jgi:FAD/FMN-containing dehydrogenase
MTPMSDHTTDILDDLKATIPGGVALPGDPDWDAARAAWALAADQHPAAVAHPATPEEVAQVVNAARAAGLRVAAHTTGHGAGPLASPKLTDAILCKTSRLTGVEIDTTARHARVGAGTVWLDVTRPASQAGLAPLAGSSPDVGVAGYTLGGGLSWLGRRYGLAANSVTALELVTADGRHRRVDHHHDPELFWALRGGGGNFGVVTALEFTLYPVPELYAGWLVWPWEHARTVLSAWADWCAETPEAVTSTARLLQFPPAPEIPEPFRGRNMVAVEAAMLCDQAEGAKLLRGLRGLRPELDTFAMVPPVALSRLHADPEQPTLGLADQTLLAGLPEAGLDALLEVAGPDTGSTLTIVELRQLGGALARQAPGAGALATLDGSFVLCGLGIAPNPEATAVMQVGLTALFDRLRTWDTGRGYANFAESYPADTRTFFPPEVYQRLGQVKREVDPDGVFLANHPIPTRLQPAGARTMS